MRRCAIFVRSGMKCTWCGVALEQWFAQIDHVVPRASGGEAVNENLVGACADCNQRRPRGWKMPRAQLAAPLDYAAGRTLAWEWYPRLMAHRTEDSKRRKREARARRQEAEGRMAFP